MGLLVTRSAIAMLAVACLWTFSGQASASRDQYDSQGDLCAKHWTHSQASRVCDGGARLVGNNSLSRMQSFGSAQCRVNATCVRDDGSKVVVKGKYALKQIVRMRFVDGVFITGL